MVAIKAAKAYELEICGPYVVAHFRPSSQFETRLSSVLAFLTICGIIVGWFPALGMALRDSGRGMEAYNWWVFWASWIGPLLVTSYLRRLEKKRATKRGSPASTLIFKKDRIDAASWPSHVTYDRGDIGTVYSKKPDTSFTYTSGRFSSNYKQQKRLAESNGKIGFSVVADYGMNEVTIVGACLTEQQAIEIRDLVGEWRDNPDAPLQVGKGT